MCSSALLPVGHFTFPAAGKGDWGCVGGHMFSIGCFTSGTKTQSGLLEESFFCSLFSGIFVFYQRSSTGLLYAAYLKVMNSTLSFCHHFLRHPKGPQLVLVCTASRQFYPFLVGVGRPFVRETINLLFGSAFCWSLTWNKDISPDLCNPPGRLDWGLYAGAITTGWAGGPVCEYGNHVPVSLQYVVYPSIVLRFSCF